MEKPQLTNKQMKIVQAVLGTIQVVLFIVALVNFIKKPLPMKDKWHWLPLLFVNTIGPIIYLVVGSKKLDAKAYVPRVGKVCIEDSECV